MSTLYGLLRRTANGDYRVANRLMIRCIEKADFVLPRPISSAFTIAKEYWFYGENVEDKLVHSRVECWTYLDSLGPGSSTSVASPEIAAIKAVICVLHEPSLYELVGRSEDRLDDTIDFFSEVLVIALGTDDEEVVAKMIEPPSIVLAATQNTK